MSWEDAWSEGRTRWDAGESAPVLRKLVERDVLPVGEALVPGCGSGYDVMTLARAGWSATGLDVAPTAAERFRRVREDAGVDEEHAEIVIESFFEWDPPKRYDLIWDYTFLCAIEPETRGEWADRMANLLDPDGQLVTLIFPVDPSWDPDGPPYPMSPELVTALLEPRFERIELFEVEESHPGREGKEWLARWRLA